MISVIRVSKLRDFDCHSLVIREHSQTLVILSHLNTSAARVRRWAASLSPTLCPAPIKASLRLCCAPAAPYFAR